MSNHVDELKSKANELLDSDFVWYPSPFSSVAIGLDWDTLRICVIDLDHPDGFVIQDGGNIPEFNTVYVMEDN